MQEYLRAHESAVDAAVAARAALAGAHSESPQHAPRGGRVGCDWHSHWFTSMVSECEVGRLRTIVRNEIELVRRDLLPSTQLATSRYNLKQLLDLQLTQQAFMYEKVGHAVATAAIARAVNACYSVSGAI